MLVYCQNTVLFLAQLFGLVFTKIPLHLKATWKLDLLTLQKNPEQV